MGAWAEIEGEEQGELGDEPKSLLVIKEAGKENLFVAEEQAFFSKKCKFVKIDSEAAITDMLKSILNPLLERTMVGYQW
jgi:hypothetical protein